jgi:hypothetical protein
MVVADAPAAAVGAEAAASCVPAASLVQPLFCRMPAKRSAAVTRVMGTVFIVFSVF